MQLIQSTDVRSASTSKRLVDKREGEVSSVAGLHLAREKTRAAREVSNYNAVVED